MANINLRKFKEKDIENIGRCVVHKIIPVVCVFPQMSSRDILKDYIERDMELEPALVIADEKTDIMLGAFDAILIDDVLLTSYYVLPWYENREICTEALGLFIEYIRKNNLNVRKIEVSVNKSDIASKIVAVRNRFVLLKQDEFSEDWIYTL